MSRFTALVLTLGLLGPTSALAQEAATAPTNQVPATGPTAQPANAQELEAAKDKAYLGAMVGTLPLYWAAYPGLPNALAGVLASPFMPAFGTGQAIQGRYLVTGWKFTAAYAALGGASYAACKDHCNETITGMFFFSMLAIRAWELIDLWDESNDRRDEYWQRVHENQLSMAVVPMGTVEKPGYGLSFALGF